MWDPHAINISGASNVHIEDVTVSPCPKCGGVGHIPDGIYSATTDTITVLVTTAQSSRSLAALAAVLQRARQQRANAEQVARLLEQESIDLKPIAALVRRLPKRLDIKYWIGITLAVIAILQAEASDRKIEAVESQVEHIYAQVVGPAAVPTPIPVRVASPASIASPYPKVGRNDPCPCGSGKKYKRCHGV